LARPAARVRVSAGDSLDAVEAPTDVFLDGLAQFSRRAYLRWIDATERRPDERQRRIAEVVELLWSGEKKRPEQARPPD
jgi:hypothetical protein